MTPLVDQQSESCVQIFFFKSINFESVSSEVHPEINNRIIKDISESANFIIAFRIC